MTSASERWVPTKVAAAELGLNPATLRHYAREGHLRIGREYRPGIHRSSPYTFDVPACVARLEHLSIARIRGESAVKELQGDQPTAVIITEAV